MDKNNVKALVKKHWLGLLISIAVPELVGLLSSLIAGNSGEIYKTLNSPPYSPPGWLFPVAWILLYALMGAASYIVVSSDTDRREKTIAIIFYAVQLALNFSWSIIFFRFEAFGAALIVLMVLLLTVSAMTALFYRINKIAGYFMIFYIAWLLVAFYLNTGVFLLN